MLKSTPLARHTNFYVWPSGSKPRLCSHRPLSGPYPPTFLVYRDLGKAVFAFWLT